MSPSPHMVLTLALIYISYFIITIIIHAQHAHNLAEGLINNNKLRLYLLKLFCGIILFGIPLYLYPQVFFNLINHPLTVKFEYLGVWAVLLITISGISFTSAMKEKTKGIIPSNFYLPAVLTVSYLPLRFIFLFTYEIFFRGFILFTALQYTNLVNAILINTFIYVLIHFQDSKKEIIGSIPFGMVLCIFTYFSNSIWPAFIMHSALAGFNESVILFYKPLNLIKT